MGARVVETNMPTFVFEAVDNKGKKIRDEIEAQSKQEAKTRIQSMGYFPSSIEEVSKHVDTPEGAAKPRKRSFSFGVNRKQLTNFTVQFSTLQDAGLPIVKSLRILENQLKPGLMRDAVSDLAEEVEGGMSLSEAMKKHPKVFDTLYISMVKAGEMGGILDDIFARLAEFMEKAYRLKKQIVGAMIYPAVVVSFACLIVTGLMIFVVPKFQSLFKERKIDLPTATNALISISDFIKSGWMYIIPIAVAGYIAFKLLTKQERFKTTFDTFSLKLPLFGTIIRKTSVSRFARTLGTLIQSGVNMLDALAICRDATANKRVAAEINLLHDAIKEGEAMAGRMGESVIFDDVVTNMVAVGEETGELDKMLIKIASNYDRDVEISVQSLVSLLEPILIVCLGGIVFFIVLALFWPLMKLIQTMQ